MSATGSSKRIADIIRMVQKLDAEWQGGPAGHDEPRSTPWMPFPLFDFVALVAEALPEAEGDWFLEVGAGVGTRMLLAREIFGLSVQGIERVPEYVKQAQELGLDVLWQDALTFQGYDSYDIIWFNRPFRDRDLQVQLEQKIWADAKPGTVIICANLEGTPPDSWYLVLNDMEVRRGIWQKLPLS